MASSANIMLRAKIDIGKSMPDLRKQVTEISRKLEAHPVKLRAKLDFRLKDVLPQLKQIQQRLENKPLKLKVEIDVKGSAQNIKKELQDVYKTVEDFNKKYGKQLTNMQEQAQKANKKASTSLGKTVSPADSLMGSFDSKRYVSELKEAEKQMRAVFGKGLFSSFETKDAQGQLTGFIAQLEKANGIVERIRYSWNEEQDAFQVIDQKTATTTEKNVKKSVNALKELERELLKLGKEGNEFWDEYNKLQNQGSLGNINPDVVSDLKSRIKDEQTLQQLISKENNFLLQQKKLIDEISRARLKVKEGKRDGYTSLRKDAQNAQSVDDLKNIRFESEKLEALHAKQQKSLDDQVKITKERLKLIRELRKLEAQSPSNNPDGRLKQRFVEEAKAVAESVKTYKELEQAKNHLNSLKNSQWVDSDQRRARKLLEDLKAIGEQLKITGSNMTQFNRTMSQLDPAASGKNLNTKDIELQLDNYTRMLKRKKSEISNAEKQLRLGEDITQIVNQKFGSTGISQLEGLIKEKDIAGLQDFIGKVYGAKVATISLKNDGVDPTGRAVTKLVTTFDSAGKSARRVSLTMSEGAQTLRQSSEEMVYNANRNLGVFEQLRIAMERVPVWMAATTAFYGTIASVQAMSTEILKLDKALTDLKRVASDSLNIDSMFQGAIGLSNELGANIHDVMGSLNEFARTFGDFNERQLLAITKTATLMANVSDLTAQESAESLVGTMNAFNIAAEDSVRIVDSLNEVDNNYAISTKQLAEGLSRSASSAKTFGVTMEESVGHITAIGAVTMESGAIIGNSLKTIYSRITTLKDAKEILQSVGVAITEIGANGEESVRPVSDILDDLGNRWNSLSAAEQQNIAVKVAGRNQLTRFLALMNNYQMSVDATKTALNSEGSAIRENGEYLKSFEARVNTLKNSFTELSIAVGNAVLSDSMLLIFSGLESLARAAISVTQSFGVLPVVFGAVAFAAMRMGAFEGVTERLTEGFDAFETSMRKTMQTTSGFRGAVTGVGAGFGALTTSLRGAEASTRSFSIAWKSMLAETVIGIAFVGLGIAIEKLVSHMAEQKRKAEELERVNNKMVQSYRNHGDGIQSLINRYDQLNTKQNKSTKEIEEFGEIQKELANSFPTVVEYVDANGQAHLKATSEIRKEIEAVRQLSQEQAKLTNLKYTDNINKQIEAYKQVTEKIKDIKDQQKELEQSRANIQWNQNTWGKDTLNEGMLQQNTKAIQQSKIEVVQAEMEKTKAIQSTIKVIQQQVFAQLESQGKLSSLGDAQKGVIENFVQQNEQILRTKGVTQQTTAELTKLGTAVGDVFANAFKKMSAGTKDPLQLDKIKQQLNDVASALPDDFFKLDKNRNADKVVQDLQKILSVSDQIKSGSEDWKGLEGSLVKAGLSANQAQGFIARLAREHNNGKLRAQAQAQGIEELTGSMDDLNEKTLETIDVTSALFGRSSGDLQAMKSHIEALQALKQVYGDNASKTEAWQGSLSALSDTLGVTEGEISSNLNHYNLVIDALQKVKVKTDDYGKATLDLSDLNKNQTNIMKDWMANAQNKGVMMDLLTGDTQKLAAGEQVLQSATDQTKQKMQDLNGVNLDNTKGQIQGVGDQANTTQGKVQGLQGALNSPVSTSLPNVAGQYQTIFDKANAATSKVSILNSNLKTPITSGYSTVTTELGSLGTSIDGAKSKVETAGAAIAAFGQHASGLGEVNRQIQGTQQSAQTASTAVSQVNDQLTQTGAKAVSLSQVSEGMKAIGLATSGLSLESINTSLSKVGNVTTTVKNGISSLSQSFGQVAASSNQSASAINNQANSMGQMSAAISKSAASVKATATAVNSVSTSFKSGASSISGYSNAVNNSVSASNRSASASKSNASAKRAEASAYAQTANSIKSMSGSYNSMAAISASASARIRSALTSQKQAVSQLQSTYVSTANAVSRTFGSMASIVKSRTSSMISSHNSQKSAINGVASAARSAKGAIDGLNSSARGAMATLTAYIAKANSARSAGSSVPSVPSVPTLGLRASSLTSSLSTGISDSINSFTASSMETVGNSIGSSGSVGTSGVMKTSIYAGGLNADGGYTFSALATSTPLAEKFKADPEERKSTVWEGIIRQQESILQRLVKTSVQYRDTLKSIIYYENLNLQVTKKDLAQTQSRNLWVNKRIHYLDSLKKQTAAQREEYNKLQQEYDSNLSKIASLQSEVESITNSIRQNSIDIFTGFIDEIVEKYDKAIDVVKSKVSDLDFKIDVLQLTQPDNVKDLLNAQAQKAKELQTAQANQSNKVTNLTNQYNSAKQQYGADSEQANAVLAALETAKKDLRDSTLAVLNAEKEIKDTRGKIADDGIKQLQDYYKNMKTMATDAIEAEKNALKKAYDEKIKLYDSEIDRINSVYDARLKAIDKEKSQTQYAEQLAEKNAKKAELVNSISLLSRDNSLEGRKKLEDLKKQLADQEKEIADFQKSYQDDLLKQSIEDQKKQQLDAINTQKEEEKNRLDSQVEALDKEKEEITEKYDNLIENDKKWADMRDQFIKGSFTGLQSELGNMKSVLDQMNRGIFDGLTTSFTSFSDEVKRQIAEMNELAVDNMIFNSGKAISDVGQAKSSNSYTYTNAQVPKVSDIKNPPLNSAPATSKPPTSTPKPNPSTAPKPTAPAHGWKTTTALNLRKSPSSSSAVVAVMPANNIVDYLGMEKGWAKVRWKGKVGYAGKSYLKQFESGGYTGDWAGNDGKLAVLHKKELVLNKRQTADILNTAKILDKLKTFIPNVSNGDITSKLAALEGMIVSNQYNLNVNIDNLNGNKEGANTVVKEIMNGLRKMGR